MGNATFMRILRRGDVGALTGEQFVGGPGAAAAVTAAAVTLTAAAYANKVIIQDVATGTTFTLPPAAGTGNSYTFVVKTAISGGNLIVQVANSTDIMLGRVDAMPDDAAAVTDSWPTTSTSDTITLNGTTTGGYLGDWVCVRDAGTNIWFVSGSLKQTGAEASPFSAAV